MTEISEKEEKIMFHTLGYDYQPRWNDDKGGYRNWFGIYPNEDDGDYKAIKSLVEKRLHVERRNFRLERRSLFCHRH